MLVGVLCKFHKSGGVFSLFVCQLKLDKRTISISLGCKFRGSAMPVRRERAYIGKGS